MASVRVPAFTTLDLEFGTSGTIAAYLVDSQDGPVLVETGPDSTFPTLERRLAEHGVSAADVRHVLVTHIHLDHAGAAWRFAAGGATVYVHAVGAPHLADPAKLLASAARIYGDAMDTLWGRVEPIAGDRLRVVGDGETLRFGGTEITALDTPGHAWHHLAFQLGGTIFTGDVGGVRLDAGPVVAPCPPPDIDLAAWRASIARIRRIGPDVLAPTHFGAFDDPSDHLDELELSLDRLSAWVRDRLVEGAAPATLVDPFEARAGKDLAALGADGALIQRYHLANPAFMSVAGLVRYWKRQGLEVPASR